jgi:SAM-dependent methyltransferase
VDETARVTAREIAHKHLVAGDALGWFEVLYAQADGDASIIPWADLTPNPNLVAWLDAMHIHGGGHKALKVGCGLGDDAEELALRGFDTAAFDISQTAISWCRRRHPRSSVTYLAADLFDAPPEWHGAFFLVVESYTLQVLPPNLRQKAVRCVADFLAPGGTLLVIARDAKHMNPKERCPGPSRERSCLHSAIPF